MLIPTLIISRFLGLGFPSNTQLDNYSENLNDAENVSFQHMALANSSLEYITTYAQNLMKFRLGLEFVNGTDLHQFVSHTNLSLQGLVDKFKANPFYIHIGEDSNNVVNLGDTINPTKARHILIATSYRSGSTFLGDLLSRYPGTFYSFEPLHYTIRKYAITGIHHNYPHDIHMRAEMQPEFVEFVSRVFKCNPEYGYFIHAKKNENIFLFKHNFRLWNLCVHLLKGNTACFLPELYYKVCPIFPIRVIKTVRLRVRETEKLLLDSELGKTLKIVVLVRDPRGVMNSRSAMPWCQSKSCYDPLTVCEDLQADVLAAHEFKKKYPS
jgi:hypothetical protein